MSGHSKWNTIKRQKAVTDQKRGQVFTKLIRAIAVAAREGGADPSANPRLRLAIERAKTFNVPKENIERALTKSAENAAEAFSAEAIGPSGVALLIEGTTDNRNRTASEIRRLVAEHGGKMTPEGGARWAFTRRGILAVDTKAAGEDANALSLELITAGAEDIEEKDGTLEIIVSQDKLEAFRHMLGERKIPVLDAALGWVPQQTVPLSPPAREALDELIEALNDHPDVQDVWSNEI